jgi:hypothetical protein
MILLQVKKKKSDGVIAEHNAADDHEKRNISLTGPSLWTWNQ